MRMETRGRARARLQTVRAVAFQWSSGHVLMISLARITWPPLLGCLVSEGHPATNRNANSGPDAMHALLAPRRPESLRTPDLLSQPRKPLRRWTFCLRPLSLPGTTRCSEVRTTATRYRCRHASHVVRPGALTVDSWVLSHEVDGHQILFLHRPVSDVLPRPGLDNPRPGRDDSTAFLGVFVRAEPALPLLVFRGSGWRGNDKHPRWQCAHTERASTGCARRHWSLSLGLAGLERGGSTTALCLLRGSFVPCEVWKALT